MTGVTTGAVACHPEMQQLWDSFLQGRSAGPPKEILPCDPFDDPDALLWEEPGWHDEHMPPPPSEGQSFVAAKKFAGARPWFFFGTGTKGLGY